MPSDQKTIIPAVPVKTPMFDESGNLTRTWIIFFERVFEGTNTRITTETVGTGGIGTMDRFVFGNNGAAVVENAWTPKVTIERNVRLLRWRITANTAPTGDSLIYDVRVNGAASLFKAGNANKIVLPAAATKAQGTTFFKSPFDLVVGDELLPYCLQIGADAPGTQIEIQIVGIVL